MIRPTRRAFDTFLPIVAGVLVGFLILVPFAVAAQRSEQVRRCGGEGNAVLAEFDLNRARDIWQRLPAMLRAPELESDDLPAHVVLFAGGFDTTTLGAVGNAAGRPATVSGAVCVIQGDGAVNLYYDVSRAGSLWAP